MPTKTKEAPAPVVEQASTALEELPKNGDVAVAISPADLFQEDAGGGLSNLKGNDYAIPFITILQKGSPQVSKNNAKYIKGAEQGMIMNTVTADIYLGEAEGDEPGGILYIPCGYQKTLVRWKPRDSGGGLVCHYDENDPILKKFGRNDRGQLYDEATKDIIIDTAYHFGLLLHGEGFPEYAVVSMASTQLKKSRTWNTVMRRIMKKDANGRIFNPPSFSHVYRLTTIGESKDTYDWYGWRIISEGEVQDIELYKLARQFSKDIEAGAVRVSAPPQEFEDDGVTGPGDDHTPF